MCVTRAPTNPPTHIHTDIDTLYLQTLALLHLDLKQRLSRRSENISYQ